MHEDKFSLKWDKYSEHLKSMMKELMMNEELYDVTLVTEDKKHIKANISILSACSPMFKDALKNSSPIKYLKGILYSEMESIMQFIYLGEATIYEERMDEFLAVAKLLEIKELFNAKPEKVEFSHQQSLTSHTLSKLDGLRNAYGLVTPNENLEEETVLSDLIIKQAPKKRRKQDQKDL